VTFLSIQWKATVSVLDFKQMNIIGTWQAKGWPSKNVAVVEAVAELAVRADRMSKYLKYYCTTTQQLPQIHPYH
jgi:hypothetical protein